MKFRYLLFAFLLVSCSKLELYSEKKFLLGTEVTITLLAKNPVKAYKAFDEAFLEVKKVNDLMNPYTEKSDVFRVNKQAGEKSVEVSDETLTVVKKAIEIAKETKGAFDITFGPLGEIWDFKKKPFTPPSKESIIEAQSKVDYKFIKIMDDKIFLSKEGAQMGLGGIAKGYSITLAMNALKDAGVKNAVVNAGGDIMVIGNKNGKKWLSAIQHPRNNKEYLAVIPVEDKEAIATSGDYERVAFYNNKRYHHIIDTKKGKPTETFSSVTVISNDPMEADALATSFFVLGLEKTQIYLKNNQTIKVVLIDLDMNIYASEELKDRLKFVNDKYDVNWF